MIAPEPNSAKIKPLTKRKKETNELYSRRAEVELQLGKILTLESTEILEFLKNKQRETKDYLFDESIVYLLRQPEKTENFREILYVELNRRLWKLFKKFYARFNNQADFEDSGQKVEAAIIRKIFDTNTDVADYAQVNFGDYAVKTAKVVWRGELVKIEREKEIFYTRWENEGEDDANRIEDKFESRDAATDYTMMLKEGLAKLPPNIMLVAELLIDGWQIESKDAQEITISRTLGVSSRTIRNWLKEARAILAEYNAEVKK